MASARKDISPEKQEYLFKTYPIFDRNHKLFQFGFDCEEGWFDLIEMLGLRLKMLIRFNEVKIVCVKEKFGGLEIRVEYNPEARRDRDKIVKHLVREVWYESFRVCERCGIKKDPDESHCKPMNGFF